MNLNKQLHFNSHMGRMGNQMFQYACAKHLELKHGFTCSLDDLSKLEYFELEKGESWKNYLKSKLFFHVLKYLKGFDSYHLEFDDMIVDYAAWLKDLKKPSMIWGFFQSPKYFEASSVAIKTYFKVKDKYLPAFDQFLAANNLKKGAYKSVHFRRTDYKGFEVKGLQGNDFTLPETYYEQALLIQSKDLPLVIVSDDPAYCRAKFSGVDNVLISENDAITDFQILSNAAELIISNSTFAWWAAWLNPVANLIVCPQYFLGFKEEKEVPVNIYPSTWKQVKI